MANIAIFRINYKSDFILTLNSDAGWMTPFCIKFWTGAPTQAYFVGFDGTTYTHCAPVDGEPTKLRVQFDDHHLPIGDLKFQIAYHFTVADFPTSVEDEVINQASVIIEVDDAPAQVMLDFTGETAPEIEFSLPAYANEAQRIANEQARIAAEQQRIANEDARIAAETIRQQNEQQRIAQETARVNEFATLKSQSQAATRDANDAATLANQKAQLASDKAALADDAAALAIQKAQLAAAKAALANDAAQLAADKAALAQQKAEYAQQQGAYAKDQGDYAKSQGNYAKEQGEIAQADHVRAEADHGIAVDDHTQAGNDHTRAESDHGIAVDDHTQAGNDHTRAESDHGIAVDDHTQAGNDHTRAESDHGIAADDHTQAGNDHTRAESDHTRAESDHSAVELYVDSLGVFDLSKHNAVGGVLATYADLDAALTALNALNQQYKYGGMSFKFVQSSDNNYVKFFCTAQDFTTDVGKWEKVNLEKELYSFESSVSKYPIKVTEVGKFINLSGEVGSTAPIDNPTSNSAYLYLLAEVEQNDKVYITGKGGVNPRLYAFLDSENKILSVYPDGMDNPVTNYEVIAPANSSKVVINSIIAAAGTCYIYKANCLEKRLTDKIEKVDSEYTVIDWFSVGAITAVGQLAYAASGSKKLFKCINYPVVSTSTDLEEVPMKANNLYMHDNTLYVYKGEGLEVYANDVYEEINKNIAAANIDIANNSLYENALVDKYIQHKIISGSTITTSGHGYFIPVKKGDVVEVARTGHVQFSLLDESLNFIKPYVGAVRTQDLPSYNGKLNIAVLNGAKYCYLLQEAGGTIITYDSIKVYHQQYSEPNIIAMDSFGFVPVMNSGYIVTSGETVDITSVTSSSDYNHAVIPCVAGDVFHVSGRGGGGPRTWCFIDSSGNVLDVAEATSYMPTNITAPANSAYLVVNFVVSLGGEVICKKPSVKTFFTPKISQHIIIAANNSTEQDKQTADIVCNGISDEAIINAAINMLTDGGIIQLLGGDYYINDTNGIYFGENSKSRFIKLTGTPVRTKNAESLVNARIHIPQSTLDKMGVNTTYSMVHGTNVPPPLPEFSTEETYDVGDQVTYSNKRWECIVPVTEPGPWNATNWAENSVYTYSFVNSICLEYLAFYVASCSIETNPSTNKPYGRPLIVIDCRNFGSADLNNINVFTDNYGKNRRLHLKEETPVKNSIAIYSLKGNNDNFADWTKINIGGFYIGYYVKAVDNLIARWCKASRCCYGFYFGGDIQKIATFINCGEEGCTHLPYFAVVPNSQHTSQVDIIDHVIEPWFMDTGPDDPDGVEATSEHQAIEEVPDTYHGRLIYKLQGTYEGTIGGSRFWKTGSGHQVRTTNIVNPVNSLPAYPEYLERVFVNNKWNTFNGTEWIEE